MSRKKGYQSRLRFFDLGNTRCPICLMPFTRDAVEKGVDVTLEHAPPKTLGGSVKCLTCTDCNSSAGRKLDQAAAMMNRAMTDRKAGRGIKVELDVCGTKQTTYFSPEGTVDAESVGRHTSDPTVMQMRDQMRDQMRGQEIMLLTEMKRGPDWDVNKGITITLKQPPPNHVMISWLRSAYLLVFSLLGQGGYRYAESEAIRPIREQIMKPDVELVPSLFFSLSSSPSKDMIIIKNQNQPFCWVVKIGGIVVLLPHGGTANHYREVVELAEQIKTVGDLRGLRGRPTKFGEGFSRELTLRKDSGQADKDLFGSEFTVPVGEYERRCVVVNQQGLVCTVMPFGPKIRRNGC